MIAAIGRMMARRGVRRWHAASSFSGCARVTDDLGYRILEDGGIRLTTCTLYEVDNEGYLMFDNEGNPIPKQS